MLLNLKSLSAISLVAFLAACATTPPKGEFVSLQQVASENAGKPWECANYDAATDSCEGLGRWTIKGDTVSAQSMVAIDAGDGQIINFTVNTTHKITNGQVCGLEGEVDMLIDGERYKKGQNFLADFMNGFLSGVLPEICNSYYRSGSGYYIQATNRDGKVMPDLSGTSTFFSTKKAIRAEAMQ